MSGGNLSVLPIAYTHFGLSARAVSGDLRLILNVLFSPRHGSLPRYATSRRVMLQGHLKA